MRCGPAPCRGDRRSDGVAERLELSAGVAIPEAARHCSQSHRGPHGGDRITRWRTVQRQPTSLPAPGMGSRQEVRRARSMPSPLPARQGER